MLDLIEVSLEFLLVPAAGLVRDRAITYLVDRAVGRRASSRPSMEALLAGVAEGDAESRQKLRERLREDHRITERLSTALSEKTGVLATPEDYAASQRSVQGDELLLDAYETVLYRAALTAHATGRPLVLEGFLQGPEWLLLCIPRSDAIDTSGPPTPEQVWVRVEDTKAGLQQYTDLDDVGAWKTTFHIKYEPDQLLRAKGLGELSRQSKTAPEKIERQLREDESPYDNRSLAERWLRVTGVRPYWVQPELVGAAFTSERKLSVPDYDDYPDDWKPLLFINEPAAGVAKVRRALDAFARADDEMKRRVAQAFQD